MFKGPPRPPKPAPPPVPPPQPRRVRLPPLAGAPLAGSLPAFLVGVMVPDGGALAAAASASAAVPPRPGPRDGRMLFCVPAAQIVPAHRAILRFGVHNRPIGGILPRVETVAAGHLNQSVFTGPVVERSALGPHQALLSCNPPQT